MAEHELPKLIAWVRFPSSAPRKQKEKLKINFSFLFLISLYSKIIKIIYIAIY